MFHDGQSRIDRRSEMIGSLGDVAQKQVIWAAAVLGEESVECFEIVGIVVDIFE